MRDPSSPGLEQDEDAGSIPRSTSTARTGSAPPCPALLLFLGPTARPGCWPRVKVKENTLLCLTRRFAQPARAASSALDCLSLFIAQREEHGEGLYVIVEKDKMP